jgi:hypothetical protein
MNTTNSLKDLGISLDALYNAEKQIEISLSDKPFTFHVILKGRDNKPDCKLSSWGANMYMRTNKGQNSEKYKTLSNLQIQLVRQIKERVNTNGVLTFSLSNEISTM